MNTERSAAIVIERNSSMNTERSDAIVARYRDHSPKAARKNFAWTKVVHSSPKDIFPLLCPSREADWIPGWDAELLFTESGYAERDCVFSTAPDATGGPGLWVFTRHEEGKGVELVKFTADVLTCLYINLEEEGPDSTRVHCEWVLTGLTEAGNATVEASDGELQAKRQRIADALDHYLMEGELIPA